MAPGCLQRHIVPASQPEHHLPGRSGLPGVKSTPVPKALPEARMLPDLGAGGRREALRGTLPLRTPGRGHTGPASADPGGDRNIKVRSDKLKFLFTERPRCHLPVPGAAPRRVMRSARPARLARVPRGTGGIRRPGGSRGRNSYSSRIILICPQVIRPAESSSAVSSRASPSPYRRKTETKGRSRIHCLLDVSRTQSRPRLAPIRRTGR